MIPPNPFHLRHSLGLQDRPMREPGLFPWAPGHTDSHTRCSLLSKCPVVTPPRLGVARGIKTGPEGPMTAAMAQFQSQR